MAMVRPAPVNAFGTIHKCLRHNFSTSCRLRIHKPQGSGSSTSRSPPPYNSLSEAPREFLSLFDSILANGPPLGPRSGKVQTEADKDLQSFQPASMSQMPIPNPSSPLPSLPPLPQRRPTQSQAGYFHVHAVSITKNIHVTITDYKHDPVVAMSAGRIGLKHSRRQTQEAAYSTAVAAFEKFSQTDLNVDQVELVLKGFGKGRAGFLSAIESAHGEFIKKKVVRITDATPMQIGAIKARNVKRR